MGAKDRADYYSTARVIMSRSFIVGGNDCNLTVDYSHNYCRIENKFLVVEVYSDGRILVQDKSSNRKTFSQSEKPYKETIEKFINTNRHGLCISSCDKFAKIAERYLRIGIFA